MKPQQPFNVGDDDSDIDPDDLLPEYLKAKAKLFNIQGNKPSSQPNGRNPRSRPPASTASADQSSSTLDAIRLERKLQKIQNDILFDQYIADQEWEKQRIQLERNAAAERSANGTASTERIPHPAEVLEESDDEVSREAAKIAAEILEDNGSDDDTALADLFASLPVTEVDPITGKSNVVVTGSDGKKVIIRDFGKSVGISPRRVLEEACKAR